jgi:penicillin-binding protein 2
MRKKFRPGVTFGDFVVHDSAVKKSRVDDSAPVDYRKGFLIWMVVLVLFGILVVRLVGLQLFYGERYLKLSEENRIKTIRLIAPRGIIYDRNGKELAVNDKKGDKWVRRYVLGEATAQILGYVSEVNADEVGLLKPQGDKYEAGTVIGRAGVETVYEEMLRGMDGGRLVEVDHEGQEIRELGRKAAGIGTSITMTVDRDLQTTALEAMNTPTKQGVINQKGAVIASDPRTGEILAMVSSPSFDPNLLAEQYGGLSMREDMPFLNRVIGAIYPPGSTFKMVTTVAAISEKKTEPGFTFLDEGIIRVNGFSFTNWLYNKGGGTEGMVGFSRAITRSTDTFFYKVGEMTTPELIGKWAKILGMGEKTGVDLPGEVSGLIPSPEWKMKVKEEPWYLGNTYHMAIGQGDVLVTPIQVNLMTNILATGGKKCKLHLVKVQGARFNGQCDIVEIDSKALELIKQGMVGACSAGGTAFPIFDWNQSAQQGSSNAQYAQIAQPQKLPVIACKTGTAEYVAENGKMKTHGWLTAFAPADDPVISVTVAVEGGGEGSNVAAPIVRQVMAKFFGVKDTYPYKNIPQEVSE